MCGFVVKNQSQYSKHLTNILFHRGPDEVGEFIDENVAMVHNRLSIIDLSASGHQPMVSSDKAKVLVFNGEIYNFKELISKSSFL